MADVKPSTVKPISIAILAMGGEGGGVLADWLVDLAEHGGQIAQSTSVPGVAQRTGATIYYVEFYPRLRAAHDGGAPVLALMPLPGDVDVVLASELMEAGRAVQRGLVTPDRTTLVASTHRVYSMTEKTTPGDGRVDSAQLIAHAQAAAKRFVHFDMAQTAEAAGSVIGAVLFGALAATGVLPFSRDQFEATIERGGVGVKASLKAFDAAFAAASSPAPTASPAAAAPLPTARDPAVQGLIERAAAAHRGETLALVIEGLRRLVDYQDPAYAATYLDRLDALNRLGPEAAQAGLLAAVARHLALWMSFEDTVRVADLKIRATRFERVHGEIKVGSTDATQIVAINEYMHPRLEEIAETLPRGLGRWLLASGWPRRLVSRFAARGRVVQTSSLRGYLLLSAVAGLRRWRRASLRFALESARIEAWLADIQTAAAHDPALATEIARCQRLVKGYGDTHARGLRHYDRLRALWHAPQRGTRIAPALLAELREAALADEHGTALAGALRRHALA